MHPGRTALLIIVLGVAACSGSPGAPTTKPLPTPDSFAPLLSPAPLSPRIASYEIDVGYDATARRLRATQRLRWTNTAARAVDMLPFHLYMNAFKNDESVFMRESRGEHRSAEASEDGWGWIEVNSIRIGGVELVDRARFPALPDETVMEVPLDAALGPGASIEVEIGFEVQLPEVFSRTGTKGDFAMVGQWFPKIGVLAGAPGQERWHCEPFHLNSEFFADFGVYDVRITVPTTHVVAATGVLTHAEDKGDGTRTFTYRAEDVHDFAWMIDPYMRVVSGTVATERGPVEVRVYHRAEQAAFAERHLQAGIGAIREFSRLYVPYPWPVMSIIDPPSDAVSGAGGMEYPMLVTTAGDDVFMRPGMYGPEYITVHEVGHNWFQGILASNEIDEAWLDEGVNEYADSVVMEAIYGQGTSMLDWGGLRGDGIALQTVSERLGSIIAPIATVSYEFPDFGSYADATYTKTAAVLRTLESIVGKDEMREAMRVYAQRFAFRHPTGDDLIRTLEDVLGRELDWYLEPALHGTGAARLEVDDIDCREKHEPRGVFGRGQERRTVTDVDAPDSDAWICEIMVVNLGSVPVPVDVRIAYTDGTETRQRWEPAPGRAWERLQVEHSAPVARVTIDPERRVLINDELLERDVRVDPETAASRRAGARVQFWTQTAMQVLGL